MKSNLFSRGSIFIFLLVLCSIFSAQAQTDTKLTSELERYLEVETKLRELRNDLVELDDQIGNLISKINKSEDKDSGEIENIYQRLKSIDEILSSQINLNLKSQEKSILNLQNRMKVIEEVISENANPLSGLLNTIEKRLVLVEEAVLNLAEDSNAPIIENMEKRLNLIEDTIVQQMEESHGKKIMELDEKISLMESRFANFENSKALTALLLSDKKDEKKSDPELQAKKTSQSGDEYDMAMLSFEQEDYSGAISLLTSFIKKYPEDKLIPNAQYWIGNAYFGLEEYKLAIKASTDLLLNYPKSAKVADGLMLIGSSREKMGNFEGAREAWQSLIDKYPETDLAKKAEERLSRVSTSR